MQADRDAVEWVGVIFGNSQRLLPVRSFARTVKDEKEYGSDKAIIKYFFCKQCQGRVLADSALRMSSSVELSDTPQHNPRTNECGPAGLASKMR